MFVAHIAYLFWWIVVPIFRFLEVVNSQSVACCDHSQAAFQIFSWGRRKKFRRAMSRISDANFTNKFPIPTNSMSSPHPLPPPMLAFCLARSSDFLHFITTVCISQLLQHLSTFTFCLLQYKITARWFSSFSKYRLKCHPDSWRQDLVRPSFSQLWMPVNQY